MVLTHVALLLAAFAAPSGAAPQAQVKVTQKGLRVLCLDGAAVGAQRTWSLAPGSHRLSATMANAPRTGAPGADAQPGTAEVTFTLEGGHRYEIEVRGLVKSFAFRAWRRGEWKPLVRDRTADREVSGEPEWVEGGCR